MFMQDFANLVTDFTLVSPREKPVTSSPVHSGIVAGTLIEAESGWMPVENLRIGDKVQTLDGGLARVQALDRRILVPDAETALVLVPGGIYDTCSDLYLLPGQHVLIDTLDDRTLGEAPYTLVPAIALAVDRLVRRHQVTEPTEIVTPLFADEEIIFANSGVLLHCPSLIDGAGRYPDGSFFPRLDAVDARDFLTRRAARLAA